MMTDNLFKRKSYIGFLAFLSLLLPYILYLVYILLIDRGPVDYETFMGIGDRFLTGQQVYGENSYYPMPYVMIFAFFRWLPRPLSMVLWFLLPVAAALYISKWNPLILLFSPLYSHFLGGQSSMPAMLGLWGYRAHSDPGDAWGGVWLALCMLKPQLAILPLGWALFQWLRWYNSKKQIPSQIWGFLVSLSILYLPSFIIQPDWLLRWLETPRPLFERALSGLFPRTLMQFISPNSATFWLILGLLTIGLFLLVWWLKEKTFTLDLVIVTSFIAHPLVHDYDLIQIIPVLTTTKRKWIAAIASLPGWLVILFSYQQDSTWYAFTLIAPLILALMLVKGNREQIHSPAGTMTGSSSIPS